MKNTLMEYLRRNWPFWAGMLLVLAVSGVFLAANGKIGSHLALNARHTPAADIFFKYYTYIGGGFPVYLSLAMILLWRVRPGVYLLAGQVTATLLTQPLKHTCAHPRPLRLFTDLGLDMPATVDGVHLWEGFNSFPSGHTSAIFALLACLAALLPEKRKYWQLALLALACLGAYSRVYLSQHFLDDIMAGAPIGALAALLAYLPVYSRSWGEYPLYRVKQAVRDRKRGKEGGA